MYTFQVDFQKFVTGLGFVACKFRTTDDAVKMHESALKKRVHNGEVKNVLIKRI